MHEFLQPKHLSTALITERISYYNEIELSMSLANGQVSVEMVSSIS